MSKKLFVGNISWGATEDDLGKLFAQYGTVEEAVIITDRATNRSKGFGFVTFGTEEEATAAIAALDGYELDGRAITVNEARPPKPRDDRY
ncbi:MAG: RNA-binding protein [Candidatus Magasanikbacteria bacterium]|nr:RNA-binding protein [Candidatus Magasanikbacteria bacterium]